MISLHSDMECLVLKYMYTIQIVLVLNCPDYCSIYVSLLADGKCHGMALYIQLSVYKNLIFYALSLSLWHRRYSKTLAVMPRSPKKIGL